MKKTLLIITAIFSSYFTFANPLTQTNHYVLENGLEVFLLEDTSDALVHLEYSAKAGFSNQTQSTNGFFKLYTRIFKNSIPDLDSAECNADSSRYKISVPNSQLDTTLYSLSNAAFALQFSDDSLTKELNHLKTESAETAKDMSGFINSAIDSRVFSGAPWQHDSGIYPPVFKKTTVKNARTILNSISEKWYTPQNSALFISGNFNTERTMNLIKGSFGRFYSSYPVPSTPPVAALNQKRKYVLHNQEFSKDITQVVVQYTALNMEQSEMLATALNFNNSSLKQALLSKKELNIPGDEYINIAAAHKKDNSRIIIQSLLQNPEAANSKITPCMQAQIFYDEITSLQKKLSPIEIQTAKQKLFFSFNDIISTPEIFMENLAEFWAIQQYASPTYYMQTTQNNLVSQTLQDFLNRKEKLNATNFSDIITAYNSEDPFIFILVNDAEFKKNKKEYQNVGFEEITTDNASWYVQQMYKEIRNQLEPEAEPVFYSSKNSFENDYSERNLSQINKIKLSNGIELTSKKNTNASDVAFLISITGGELKSAVNHGMEEVIINLVAGMIQKEFFAKQREGIILGNPSIKTYTNTNSSYILINCDSEDFNSVCASASKAIIYGEIAPAAADRAVSARQYKKRLENGSAAKQMYSAAINTIYGNTDLSAITSTKGDILEKTNYNSILQAYPEILDAKRFNLILSGNFDSSAPSVVEKYFRYLNPNKGLNIMNISNDNFPKNKAVTVNIVHTFLTDIPAEKAGPQPAVLIPTTEFLDPVVYGVKAPSYDSNDFVIFNALLNYIENEFQRLILENQKISQSKVSVQLAKYNLTTGFITVQNVSAVKELDNVYKQMIYNLNKQLTSPTAKSSINAQIKNLWTKKQLSETASNSGTAVLLQKGIENSPYKPNTTLYLEEFNIIQNAGPQDFIEVLKYFPATPDLRIYSRDSK